MDCGDDQDTEPLKEIGPAVVNTVKLPEEIVGIYTRNLEQKVPPIFQPGDVVVISLVQQQERCEDWFRDYPDITFIDIGSNRPFYKGC